ncbi:8535_t:CDS:2 [Diversispora eburnea]|uniref:8535_t:CDS:1 n=1 Tax=Diversispora eburnea TaxID=1213867 RepID=A0A9N8V649_9GLOM|nr:8535_t:CDS:2 [Diversispora eburnea]
MYSLHYNAPQEEEVKELLKKFKEHLFKARSETIIMIEFKCSYTTFSSTGSNGKLNMIFDRIKKLNKGEKHLKITCDNAEEQNKNNVTVWFCLYYESVEMGQPQIKNFI